MSWVITAQQKIDADAAAYIAAVEAADGQALETAVKDAIDAFVRGCKQDGTWSAIKACCILAGARTLAGALVPLVGSAPTRFGTEGGWNYNRKTGLQGNGTDNYIDSGRSNNADPQNNKHLAIHASVFNALQSKFWIGTNPISGFPSWLVSTNGNILRARLNQSQNSEASPDDSAGFHGAARSTAANTLLRVKSVTQSVASSSGTPLNENINVFRCAGSYTPTGNRIAFYSIGEAVDLALLDARVTALMNTLAAAIP